MREIKAELIKEIVKDLFIKTNYFAGKDLLGKFKEAVEREESPIGKSVLDQIIRNAQIAAEEKIAICQDTGMAVLFVELGQDVRIVGGDFNEAVNSGIREAYEEGYLRRSVVNDPLFDRKNTGDNTPAVIHIEIVKGDRIKLIAVPKGFGSENMSAVKMFTPAEGVKGVKDFVVETVLKAGPNPCPPIVVGVGIGGTMEKAALLAKKALTRPLDRRHPDERYAKLESEILDLINSSGIGPAGLGGRTTALAVNIEYFPTHIAGLPVAVNISCHAYRHAEATI
ncbi:fumarate hydratase [Thermosediminibacter litoriperuensis]|uniref:Fumarate hydratase subunit alpha n=1 Tax=Thermosediminibacter litoriperuensis TaxID=291989 RepID=A0A5S5ACV2_9FIRM|nr:fumarate hydratase [Thermosediminibacter litoriperuensis]TYP47451.1 fumarate hydratase subunit alpha [Thermosediminibacter litoriperuensis]